MYIKSSKEKPQCLEEIVQEHCIPHNEVQNATPHNKLGQETPRRWSGSYKAQNPKKW